MTIGLSLFAAVTVAQADPSLKYPDVSKGRARVERGGAADAKMSPELRSLYSQFAVTRGVKSAARFTDTQLRKQFGISAADRNPSVTLMVSLKNASDAERLNAAGATVLRQIGSNAWVYAPVLGLRRLASESAVLALQPMMYADNPERPETESVTTALPVRGEADPMVFDKQGMTGKGVIVGVVDTGLDWKHADFVREDGSSRVLYLYDMSDNSWKVSSGKIGTEPPVKVKDQPIGTLYTNAQINDALKGKGTVNSKDKVGHGTACAGIAAGNGRADSSIVGLAPEADLLIVKWADGALRSLYPLGAEWMKKVAGELKRPLVINMSLGGQFTAHDGNEPDEIILNALTNKDQKGMAICVAAGNEGRDSFHARSRFGPRREGQEDVDAAPIELFVTKQTWISAYFNKNDEWGLALVGRDNFAVDDAGAGVQVLFFKVDGAIKGLASKGGSTYTGSLTKKWDGTLAPPKDFSDYFNNFAEFSVVNDKYSRVDFPLPPGRYLVWGFGATEKVTDGRFSFYAPGSRDASFGKGVTPRYLVGTPGCASNVITVGAYLFRGSWQNADGKQTNYNMEVGSIAPYSSMGYRIDEEIKPDIIAPGTYAISSLAEDSEMGEFPGKSHIAKSGKHVAWTGTSAATPYVTGLVALMLQKNPTLNSEQLKSAIIRSATRDAFTGSVPNPTWGHGKVNASAALKAVTK